MNLELAQALIRQFGAALGGTTSTYTMDDNGEVQLVMDDSLPILIRFADPVLIIAAIVATDVEPSEPDLFVTLMDYQYMGLRTNGYTLSWNGGTSALQLSAHMRGEPDVTVLVDELSTLIETALEVREELATIIAYQRTVRERAGVDLDDAPETAVLQQPAMLRG